MNKRDLGGEKELLAAKHLEEKGYTILQMNYKVRQAEIDIVALLLSSTFLISIINLQN